MQPVIRVSKIPAVLIPEELLSIRVRMVGAENRVVDCGGGVNWRAGLPIRPGTGMNDPVCSKMLTSVGEFNGRCDSENPFIENCDRKRSAWV